MNAEWRQWRRETFGDPYLVWHDGPDFALMLAAAPETVGHMLRAGLADGDPLAASGFAELATAGTAPPDAIGLLRTAATTANGELLIRIAQALFALTCDPSWAEPIVRVLQDGESEYVRLDAAMALAGFPRTDALVAAVAEGVRDNAYLVRYHSANTLLRYNGDSDDISTQEALFTLVASNSPDDWEAAAARLSQRPDGKTNTGSTGP